MIFTVDAKEFRAALQIAGRVIPQKSPWPILSNVKIITNDDRITLIGSDSDTTFEADVPAEIETEGAACVPFDALSKFVSAAKSGALIKLTLGENSVKAQAGRSRITLSAGAVDDYPNYRPPEGDLTTLDRETFTTALRFCASASEDSEVRYNMAGPHFSERETGLHIFGTEGKVIHRAIIADVTSIGGGGTLPLPAALVVLAMAEKVETLSFMISDRGWHLSAGSVRVWGKVIDSAYPDVDRILDGFPNWDEFAVASSDDLSTALSVASCGAEAGSDKARNLIIRAQSGKPVVVRGHKAAGGVVHAGRAEMDTDAKSDFVGAINAKYLTNAIGGMKSDDVSMLTASRDDGASVISLRPAQQSATLDMSALIMALRVSESEMTDV